MTPGAKLKAKKPKSHLDRANAFDWINGVLLSLVAVIMFFPFYYTVIVSFATYGGIVHSNLYVLPVTFSLEAYEHIFKGSGFIIQSFFVSVFITLTGTILSMIASVGLAYGASKTQAPFTRGIMIFVVFTMFFSAGLIPYYLTVKEVGLVDSVGVMLFPMLISAFNIILLRNYFLSVEPALEESARIDGANDLQILIKVILPISAPIMATISLFYAVDRWNEWWHPYMFIMTPSKRPLQLVLREILFKYMQVVSSPLGRSIREASRPVYTRTLQMAVVVLSAVPIMMCYPYLQKHFTKGLMLGSVKG